MGESVNLPALVAPGPPLSLDQVRRYARNLTVPAIGESGQRRLRAARVLCVGAGGLGSPAILYLAAAGIGTLGVIDDDDVETSNLQRQVLHGVSVVGSSKVSSAAARVRELNPEVDVVEHRVRLSAANAVDLVSGYDLVLDGSDTFETRYVLSDACSVADVPHVWGSILRFDGQLSVFWSAHGPTYRDLHPVPPAAGSVPNCAEAGVLGALPGVIGSAMALEAMKVIMGVGQPLVGRVSTYDALDGTWAEIPLRRSQPAVQRMYPFGDPARDGYGDSTAAACALVPGNARGTGLPGVSGVTEGSRDGAPVDTVEVLELQEMLAARERGERDFLLVDVRESWEHQLSAIPGSVLIPVGLFRSGEAFPSPNTGASVSPDRPVAAETVSAQDEITDLLGRAPAVVLHCHSGARSAEALQLLREADRRSGTTRRIKHLAGGMTAWLHQDPCAPRA